LPTSSVTDLSDIVPASQDTMMHLQSEMIYLQLEMMCCSFHVQASGKKHTSNHVQCKKCIDTHANLMHAASKAMRLHL